MKSAEDPHLIALATTVADGAPVDWDQESRASTTAADRDLVEGLRLLEHVARVHASTPARMPQARVARTSLPFPSWGPLHLVEAIGAGTSGTVYRAWDPRLDRHVALKLLSPQRHQADAAGTLSNAAIVDEGRLMARIRHPGVVTVFGADQIDGRVGIWMELVDGRTLEAEVRERGPLPPDELTQIGVHLADALAAVHRAGLVHRDVKAQNVMREAGGRIVLMDFGTGADLARPDARTLAGTPLYLAPELLDGGSAATPRTDVYSLGVLLFYLATGRFPVAGATLREVRRSHADGTRARIAEARPNLPRVLARAIDRALAPDPAARHADAAALAADLHLAASLPARRRRLLLAAASVVVLVASGWVLSRLGAMPAGRAPAGIVQEQIDPAIQQKYAIKGPVFADWLAPCAVKNSGHIAVCDLRERTSRVLREPTDTDGSFAEPSPNALLSPDGKRMAYTWALGTEGRASTRDTLQIAEIDTGKSWEVFQGSTIQLTRWMPDGRSVVLRDGREDSGRYLRVPVDGSTPHELLKLSHGDDGSGDLSPDGRTMVVAHVTPSGTRDLVTIDVETGRERWRKAGPTDDFEPRWTPDGRSVVFLSDAHGCEGLFQIQPGATSQQVAIPLPVPLGRQRTRLFGFGPDGSLLLMQKTPKYSVLTAALTIDLQPTQPAHLLQPSRCDLTMGAELTADGTRIAYVAARSGPSGRARVIVERADGSVSNVFELPDARVDFAQVRWHPGETSLAVSYFTWPGPTASAVSSLRTIDLARSTQIELFRTVQPTPPLRSPVWDSSANAILVLQGRRVLRLREGSEPQVIYASEPEEALEVALDVSQTGKLALGIRPLTKVGSRCVVRVLDPESGRTTYRTDVAGHCQQVAWTPDGRILVGTAPKPGESLLWLVDPVANSSTTIPLQSHEPNFWDMRLSRDGTRLLFTGGRPAGPANMVLVKGIR